jgi:glycosyltransferase involved in cell wall biosynthesis
MKLSVIIPNYNHGSFINEQIESIVNQTYKCHEIIIIDDKSTDNSVEIINKIIDRYPFIKLVQNKKNIGPLNTLNHGLEISSGDYIYFPSADDRICSNLFEEAAKQFKNYPDAGLFSALGYQMEKNGKFQNLISSPLISSKPIYLTPEKAKKYLVKYGFWIVGQTMIFNKSSFRKLNIKFNPKLKHYSDIFVPLIISLKFGACFTPKTLASWRYYTGYAEQHFSNKNLNNELFLEFSKVCLSKEYNDLVPKIFLKDMIKSSKYLYINRRFYHHKKNRFFELKISKIIIKFFIYLYVFNWQLIKIFRIMWAKRRFKDHFIIKDDLLLRK